LTLVGASKQLWWDVGRSGCVPLFQWQFGRLDNCWIAIGLTVPLSSLWLSDPKKTLIATSYRWGLVCQKGLALMFPRRYHEESHRTDFVFVANMVELVGC